MEISEDELVQTYADLETEELIELHHKGELTETATRALRKVLETRGVTSKEIDQIQEDVVKRETNVPPLASLGSRFMAQLIDKFIALILLFFPMLLVGADRGTGAALGIFLFLVYALFQDSLPKGQSLGKIPMKIAVVNKTSGKYCKRSESVVRNGLLVILGIIDLLSLGSKHRQRLGDMLANTIVIQVDQQPHV